MLDVMPCHGDDQVTVNDYILFHERELFPDWRKRWLRFAHHGDFLTGFLRGETVQSGESHCFLMLGLYTISLRLLPQIHHIPAGVSSNIMIHSVQNVYIHR
jgi:hypothetical protein